VLDACPDHNWKCIVVLARYGGLRCPSEVLSLRWQDIDWAGNRIIVTSPKTEHHAGKASRTIPLFPELRPYLEKAFELAQVGAVYVVDEKYRKAANGPAGWMNANLRTRFGKIIECAGLTSWPRLFHNLRAGRETELVEKYPVQVVTDWLGNTPKVAMRHYLMTTDAHFEDAVKGDRRVTDTVPDEAFEKTAQKTAQQAHAGCRNDSHATNSAHEKTPVLPGYASSCELARLPGMAGTGFEPATSRL
jgi:integrase